MRGIGPDSPVILPSIAGPGVPGDGGVVLPVGPTDGGTGIQTYAKGDIIIASVADVLAALGIGSLGEVLTVGAGGVPAWAAGGGGGALADFAQYTWNVSSAKACAGASWNLIAYNAENVAPGTVNISFASGTSRFTFKPGFVYVCAITNIGAIASTVVLGIHNITDAVQGEILSGSMIHGGVDGTPRTHTFHIDSTGWGGDKVYQFEIFTANAGANGMVRVSSGGSNQEGATLSIWAVSP